MENVDVLTIKNIFQILSILILFQFLVDLEDIFTADPAVEICYLLEACNLSMLMLLYCLNKVSCINKALMCSRIKPSKALS